MINSPARTDTRSLRAIIGHWLVRAHNEGYPGRDQLEDNLFDWDIAPSRMVGLKPNEKRPAPDPSLTFASGFEFGMRTAIAVLADPFGDPVNVIQSAAEEARSMFDYSAAEALAVSPPSLEERTFE